MNFCVCLQAKKLVKAYKIEAMHNWHDAESVVLHEYILLELESLLISIRNSSSQGFKPGAF